MWRICFQQQYSSVGTQKYCVSTLTTCGWVSSRGAVICSGEHGTVGCFYGRKTHAQGQKFVSMIFYFHAIRSSVFPLHVTSDLFHDTWSGHPSALPVNTVPVTQEQTTRGHLIQVLTHNLVKVCKPLMVQWQLTMFVPPVTSWRETITSPAHIGSAKIKALYLLQLRK